VSGVLVLPTGEGYAIDLSVPEEKINRARMAKRSLEGRTGCGLCGIEDMKDAIRMPGHRLPSVPLAPEAVARAYDALPSHQPMSRVNRTVHAAAWCSVDGDILLSREDVGRHNALDKLIGALARERIDTLGGFALVTSRCSLELLHKAVRAGIGTLVSLSAPTALTVEWARRHRLNLIHLPHHSTPRVYSPAPDEEERP